MLFTPKYTVAYHGVFHMAGTPFEIEPGDAEEMSRHGTVEKAPEPHTENDLEINADELTAKRPGRPRKN